MRHLAFATLLVPATAAAEPRDSYVGATASLMLERTVMLGGGLEGGARLLRGDTLLHGHWTLGARGRLAAGSSAHGGRWMQARAGVEGRLCFVQGWVCGLGGMDLGYQYDHAIQPDYDGHGNYQKEPFDIRSNDVIAVPRIGVELGAPVRLRAEVELPQFKSFDGGAGQGLALTGGIAFAF